MSIQTLTTKSAILRKCPEKYNDIFVMHPFFSVEETEDGRIEFRDLDGKWFIRTSTIASSSISNTGIKRATTESGSTYEWREKPAYVFTGLLNGDSGHIGSRCIILHTKAELGKDYGISNLIAMKANQSRDFQPNELHVCTVVYEDGAYRKLGLKAVREEDGLLRLYGNRSRYSFKRI